MYIAYNPALLDWDELTLIEMHWYQLPHIQRPPVSPHAWMYAWQPHICCHDSASGVAWRQCTHPRKWRFGKCPSFHLWQFWDILGIFVKFPGGKRCCTTLTMLKTDSSSKLWVCIISELLGLEWFEFPATETIRSPTWTRRSGWTSFHSWQLNQDDCRWLPKGAQEKDKLKKEDEEEKRRTRTIGKWHTKMCI